MRLLSKLAINEKGLSNLNLNHVTLSDAQRMEY